MSFLPCLEIQRLVWETSERVKEGITRDALAHQQLQFELLGGENISNVPSAFSAPALGRPVFERTPFPQRPLFPPISDGFTAQFSAAPQPSEVETLFDYGDLTIAMAVRRLELAIRGGSRLWSR